MSATIGTGVARCLAEIAAARGIAPGRVREWAGGAALADPDARMPFTVFAQLWHEVATALGDDAIVFAVADKLRLEDYGLMGLACMAASDGRQALARVVRWHRLFTDAGEWDAKVRGPRF